MHVRRRITLRSGPVNVTPGNHGAGVSVRLFPGLRVGRGADGRFRTTIYVPGTGVSWTLEPTRKAR